MGWGLGCVARLWSGWVKTLLASLSSSPVGQTSPPLLCPSPNPPNLDPCSNAQTRALSHPLPVLRAREIDRWSQSQEYQSLVAANLPR